MERRPGKNIKLGFGRETGVRSRLGPWTTSQSSGCVFGSLLEVPRNVFEKCLDAETGHGRQNMEDAAVLQSLPDDRHRSIMKRRKQTDHVIFADHIRAKSVQKVKSG
jgi:hypothetical protein